MSELPEGWVATTLGDLGRWSSGGTPSKRKPEYYGGDIPWVRTGDLRDNEIHDVEGRISPEGLANSSAKEFPSGTLLVAMYGATIGRTGMLRIPATTNQACAALLPDPVTEDMMPFLWWFFRHKVEDFRAVGQGGAQPNISQTVIKASAIDLPPLPEQRRIVAKLGRLSARSAAARDHLARTTKLATRAKQAILDSVFANDWPTEELREFVDPERGIPYGIVQTGTDTPGGVPTVRCGDIKRFQIAADALKRVEPDISTAYDRTILRGGEVLIAIRGSVGETCVVPPSMAGCNISREVALIPVLEGTDAKFVMYFLQSRAATRFIKANIKGVAQTGINLRDLRTLPTPRLGEIEQTEIVLRIESAFTRIDRLTEEASRAADLLDRLDERLLAKAFRGELVPQNPEDEPAEALLTRIREARAAAPKAKRGRRKAS